MFEYLINVKSMREDEYYKEKEFYVGADSVEEAIKNAVEFFIDEEDSYNDPLNIIGLETKVLGYSEVNEDIEDNEELNFNITIKPIQNEKQLRELSSRICRY